MKKPNGYWTYERCQQEAKKFNYRKELKDNLKSCYLTILRNKWYELMQHMLPLGNSHKRCVYVYEFIDNYVYVGLTYNFEKRINEHKNDIKSAVYSHISTNIYQNFEVKKISNYIDKIDAISLEIKTIDFYKNNGWKILNRVKGGSLGTSKVFWTKERCMEEALKFKTKKEFRENSYSCYKICMRNKYLQEATNHMIEMVKPKGFWTKERCMEEVLKFKTKKEFRENSIRCYKTSSKNNWLVDMKHLK